MNRSVIFLGVALLITGVAAVHLWHELRGERERNSALQASALLPIPGRLPAVEVAPPLAPATQGQVAVPIRAPQASGAAVSVIQEGIEELVGNPTGQALVRAQLRELIHRQYPDIGRMLNLSPEEVGKLLDMLARQQSDKMEMRQAMRRASSSEDMALNAVAIESKTAEMQHADQNELAATLGSKYLQFQNYEETRDTRIHVDRLQSLLGTGNNALGDARADSLVTALDAERKAIQQEMSNRYPGDFLQARRESSAEYIRRLPLIASAYLNPEQLDRYSLLLNQQNDVRQLVGSALEAQSGNLGQTPPSIPTTSY